MRHALSLVVIAVVCSVFLGCARLPAPQRAVQQGDVIADKDFVARIRTTKEPYVFEVSVERVSGNPEAAIGGLPATVDLVLKDGTGKVYAARNWEEPQYAEEIGVLFSTARHDHSERLAGKFRLVKDSIPPGKYTVQPRVRIRQPLTVTDYPAANSVQVVIR